MNKKVILLSLLIVNILFFNQMNNVNLSYADEQTESDCEDLLSFKEELINELKINASDENIEKYNEAIKEKIKLCSEKRVEDELLSLYEVDDLSFSKFVEKNEGRTIDQIVSEYDKFREQKEAIDYRTSSTINTTQRSQFLISTGYDEFDKQLSTMTELINSYYQAIGQDKTANQDRVSRIPNLQKTCL